MRLQRQKGISLLEVLLVVAVAAAIVSAAIFYYSQTILYTHVSQATNLIQEINKAGYEWLKIQDDNGKYKTNFSTLGTAAQAGGNGLKELVNLDLVPCTNNSCYTNPWGGEVLVEADADANYMLITLSALPQSDCMRLQAQMADMVPTQENTCTSSSSLFDYQVAL